MVEQIIRFVREQYRSDAFIPLHAPVFGGRERDYVLDTIESTFVSSVGAYVDRFEQQTASYTGAARAVATVNGTAALHMALLLAGVQRGDLVITQALTFVATCNAIAYCSAEPVFVDVDRATLGLSPQAMQAWLDEHAFLNEAGLCQTRADGKIVRACVPMHTFGHPADLDGLLLVCQRWNIFLLEDAAESLGSLYKGKHTGTFGQLGILSYNGNKIITTGGGGMILAGEELGARAKYLTTTAKQPHPYEFVHDEVGYNYRLPNINAALGCAQMERIEDFVLTKRVLAGRYAELFKGSAYQFMLEPDGARSNYWLNAVICDSAAQRDALLQQTNAAGVMTRPIWQLMNRLPAYAHCRADSLSNSTWLEARVVNLPSSLLPREAA